MTQDNMPDRIYAWFFIERKQSAVMLGGWDDKFVRRETPYLKATPAREAAEDMLEALESARHQLEAYELMLNGESYNDTQINAAIAKAKGETE